MGTCMRGSHRMQIEDHTGIFLWMHIWIIWHYIDLNDSVIEECPQISGGRQSVVRQCESCDLIKMYLYYCELLTFMSPDPPRLNAPVQSNQCQVLVGHSVLTHWLQPPAVFAMAAARGQTVCCRAIVSAAGLGSSMFTPQRSDGDGWMR